MINPPKTSYEWNKLLELIKEGSNDEEVLSAMQHGNIDWIGGVANIFVNNLLNAVDYRLQKGLKTFQQSFNYVGNNEGVFISNIRNFKNEIKFLYKLVSLKCIPEEERVKYQKLVQNNADKIQENLKKASAIDKTGRILYIIEKNPINNIGE